MTWGELKSGKDRVISNADRATAHQAIAELIWNAIDAEATRVEVRVDRNELGAPAEVVVADTGHGINPDDVHELFLTEGDSWKREQRFSPTIRRPLHGRLGRGRLLGYSVAETVQWDSVFATSSGNRATRVVGRRADPAGFDISESMPTSESAGTTVRLKMLDNQKAARVGDETFSSKLIELMAESLEAHSGVEVVWDGTPLHARDVIARRSDCELPVFTEDVLRGHGQPVLTVIEWTAKGMGSRMLRLCDEAGSAVTEFQPSVLPGLSWTAYLKWSGFSDPQLMGVGDLHHPEFSHGEMLTAASMTINHYVADRLDAERGVVVDEWKKEGVYPYVGEPASPIETAERDVFEVVAVIASGSIPRRGADQKRLALRLIKESLQADPQRLHGALSAVLKLTDGELEQLDRLLARTELSALIRAASRVANRLDFVGGLSTLLYADETRTEFREVDQLHPMLVQEPWVFGDEWDGCLSEHGLTRVVKSVIEKHADKLIAVTPVTLEDGRRGRLDLLFHKVMPESEWDRHLVVELKRPGKLTMEHYGQLVNYATTITEHPEVVDTSTKWDFWLVGSDMDASVASQRSGDGLRKGFVKDFGRYRLWIVRWGELLDDLRRKYESYRETLDLQPTTETGLDYLHRIHAEYLPPDTPGGSGRLPSPGFS